MMERYHVGIAHINGDWRAVLERAPPIGRKGRVIENYRESGGEL
ncbi:MAG TPA: hypothetical protein VIM73_16240 [Polyangiaceae bacterium]